MFRRRQSKTEKSDSARQINRRDLLQGKIWKLLRPPGGFAPLVRYLHGTDGSPADDQASANPGQQSIQGIVVEPVAPTKLSPADQAPPIPVFRPPGAITEHLFLAGCTRCNDCADACPHEAIRKAPPRLGAIAGTPTIQADTAACLMCEDYPCIAACEPGVLVDSIPKVIGTAS